MRTTRVLAIVAAFAMPPVAAHAADNDGEIWVTASASGSLSGRLLGSFEIGARPSNDPTRRLTVFVRPAVGYQASPHVSLWAGYARFTVSPDNRAAIEENRLFQQVSWSIGKVAGGALSSRTRLEQRMFAGRHDTGWRARQALRWVRPLGSKGTNVVVSSEVLVALNSTDSGARAGLDQIRNFVGVNVPLAKGVSLESGYLNRYVRRVGTSDRIDHIIPVTVALKF